jgi:hypothetical protein
MSLLQPEAYQIASAEEEWFPPSYYAKFKDIQRKIEADEKRKEREEQRDRQEADTGGRRDNLRTAAGGTTATGNQPSTPRETAGGGWRTYGGAAAPAIEAPGPAGRGEALQGWE